MEEGGGSIKKEKTAAEIRKSNKPLMEKRRRERINNCLDQLKSILMEVTKKESSYYSKLEKADILEMTVKYLKNMKRQQLAVAMANDPSVVSKYIAGFNECTSEVTKYLGSVDGLTPEMKTRLMSHLADCLQRQFAANQSLGGGGANQNLSTASPASLGLQIPAATQLNALPGTGGGVCVLSPGNVNPSPIQTIPASPMQLVPAKLPSGDLVFLLTNPSQMNTTNGGVPVVSALSTPGHQSIINIAPAQIGTSTAAVGAAPVSSTMVLSSNQFELNNNNNNNTTSAGTSTATLLTTAPPAGIKEEKSESPAPHPGAAPVGGPPSPRPAAAPAPEPLPQPEDEDRVNNNGQLAEQEGPMWRPW